MNQKETQLAESFETIARRNGVVLPMKRVTFEEKVRTEESPFAAGISIETEGKLTNGEREALLKSADEWRDLNFPGMDPEATHNLGFYITIHTPI